MRLSRFELATNVSLMFTEVPFLERFAAAKSAGFDLVECWWPFETAAPAAAEVDAVLAAIASSGVRMIGFNFSGGAAGVRGLLSRPDLRDEFAQSLDVVRRVAEETGCRQFNALYGQRVSEFTPEEQNETALQNLALATGRLADLGGVVLLEPLTAADNGDYALVTAADAQRVIDAFSGDGVRFLFDSYHLSNNGEDLHAVITEFGRSIGHVQFADTPGRHEPGTGTIDFVSLLSDLDEVGYEGVIAAEYAPSGATGDSLGWIGRLSGS